MAKEGIGSKACTEQRKKLKLPEFNEMNSNVQCNVRFCYSEGCPIFDSKPLKEKTKFYCAVCGVTVYGAEDPLPDVIARHNKTRFHQVNLNGTKDLGQGFKTDGTRHIPANLKDDVNVKVFEEIGDDDEPKKKSKKEKNEDSEQALRHFINLQSRVLSKLAWHPEIYEALDSLSSYEILERLCGKSVMEAVPPQMGGKMELKASPKTKKMFEALEKKFEKEDEAKGRPPPRNFDNEDDGFGARPNEMTMTWMDIEDADDLERKKKEIALRKRIEEGKKKNGEKKN